MIKGLIEVKQLPVIEEQLRSVSTVIDERVKNATSLVCTEESVKTIKEIRAELNKDYKEFENKRKLVKEQVLKPYNDFENVYKECISDKFRNADIILKGKIDNVENELKSKKEKEIKDYFEEYKEANNIDFITYEQARINITLSASMKSLKEQAKQFIDKIVDDLKLIETQEHKTEILVEYKQILNVSQAITSVTNRFKAIEEEKKKIEQEKELQKFVVDTAKESDKYSEQIILISPSVEEKTEEILTLKFTVRGTRTKLRELKQFLESGGYDYE
jgi:hypothetical protein|nr:MAG TPA: Protein of unknown function (DUF1351) [Caudoviricetes sp.]DAM12965.1 MAG TPA: Protein of unknown function (DUF1351) [Caudoviricetes sp.]